ncbi:hypothetical protein ACFVVQ_12225 [Paenibacillus chitinolyticus]
MSRPIPIEHVSTAIELMAQGNVKADVYLNNMTARIKQQLAEQKEEGK